MTRATVIADASLCGETKLAAWGAWIKVDGKPSQVFSGQLRNRMGNSTDAEICALANALAKGVSTALIPPGTEVMLQSDSTQALGLLKKLVPNVTVRQHKDSAELATFRKPQLCGGVRAEAAGGHHEARGGALVGVSATACSWAYSWLGKTVGKSARGCGSKEDHATRTVNRTRNERGTG